MVKSLSMTVATPGSQFVVSSEPACWTDFCEVLLVLYANVPPPLFLVLDKQLHNASPECCLQLKFCGTQTVHGMLGPGYGKK